jgi:hypothetical protein
MNNEAKKRKEKKCAHDLKVLGIYEEKVLIAS